MTADVEYVLTSLLYAVYGLALGFSVGCLARLLWMIYDRKW
jgi:hypothetical protein